jgi:membrane protein implicated in regulation of membrane protease activity
MRWIQSIARRIFGLFVDDGSFAVAILVWLGLAMAGVPRTAVGAQWAGAALFAGLAVILIENVLRFARRRMK